MPEARDFVEEPVTTESAEVTSAAPKEEE